MAAEGIYLDSEHLPILDIQSLRAPGLRRTLHQRPQCLFALDDLGGHAPGGRGTQTEVLPVPVCKAVFQQEIRIGPEARSQRGDHLLRRETR